MKEAIIKLLQKWACHHKWSLYKEREVNSETRGTWFRHTFVCKECGKFKQMKV